MAKIIIKINKDDKIKALKRARRELSLKNPGISLLEKIQPGKKEYKRRPKHKSGHLEDI